MVRVVERARVVGGDPFDEINFAGGGVESQMVNRRGVETSGAEGRIRSRFRATLESVPRDKRRKAPIPSFYRFPSHKRFSLPPLLFLLSSCSRIRTARIDESELCRDVLITSRFSLCSTSNSYPSIARHARHPRRKFIDAIPHSDTRTWIRSRFANLPETLRKSSHGSRSNSQPRSLTWKLSYF